MPRYKFVIVQVLELDLREDPREMVGDAIMALAARAMDLAMDHDEGLTVTILDENDNPIVKLSGETHDS